MLFISLTQEEVKTLITNGKVVLWRMMEPQPTLSDDMSCWGWWYWGKSTWSTGTTRLEGPSVVSMCPYAQPGETRRVQEPFWMHSSGESNYIFYDATPRSGATKLYPQNPFVSFYHVPTDSRMIQGFSDDGYELREADLMPDWASRFVVNIKEVIAKHVLDQWQWRIVVGVVAPARDGEK